MKLLDVNETARALYMSAAQVNRLMRDGILSYVQYTEGGKRYVTDETIDRFIAQHLIKGKY